MIDAQLKSLLRLQKLDLTLLQLKKEANHIPERKEQLNQRSAHAKGRLEAAKAALRARDVQIKDLENATEAVRQRINRYKNQQMEVKTNESYKALEHEIAQCGEEISGLEDQELELMETLDALKADVRKAEGEVATAQTAIDEECNLLDERLETVRDQFGELKAQREEMAAEVDEDLLKKYFGHLSSKQDAYVVPIRQQTCGGCHMKLTPQILHDVNAMTRLTTCNYCGRLLYDASLLGA
ncbi:MAG: hypothetical protein JJU29_06125 [Verrucomicrobia bacterium]|nr:hypothetical protein [Verrucomicrobiota bacterium]MCH8511830.1 C4-type zinc ribbon domain-containing protein [Kiritimatiellia bacterium]